MSNSIMSMFEFTPRRDHRDECYSKIRSDYPTLGPALIGSYDTEKKSGHRGATLMIFLEDDRLKFTLHHKPTRTTLFGTLPDLVLSLEDIEACLVEGRFDAKTARS